MTLEFSVSDAFIETHLTQLRFEQAETRERVRARGLLAALISGRCG